jgi:iron complex transport system substrate-binding protein
MEISKLVGMACLALVAAVAGCAPAPDRPVLFGTDKAQPRVVSINPCVDAILIQVADKKQIVGISHFSQDPRATSMSLALAQQFEATSGTAEEVVALTPDIVIAGAHVAPSTIAALKRMGIELVQIGVPVSIAESKSQIRTIAAAVGHADRGEELLARIDSAVKAAQENSLIPALIWQGGGLVPGDGTLASDMLHVSGFRNMSASYGLKSWDVLPLEHLVSRPPQVLLSVGASAKEDRMLGHPVMSSLKQRIAVRDFPERLLHCGGPTIIDAVGYLAQIRRAL